MNYKKQTNKVTPRSGENLGSYQIRKWGEAYFWWWQIQRYEIKAQNSVLSHLKKSNHL